MTVKIFPKRKRRGRNQGFSLVEMMVVLALIGLTAGLGAVYISANDTELRGFARDIRFDLERAKQEALARKDIVYLELSYDPPSVDCNEDGAIDDRDRCYVLYQDLDGDAHFTPGVDEKIKVGSIEGKLRLINDEPPGELTFSFSPTGESASRDVEIKAAVPVQESCCPSGCMAVSYPLAVSHVGRIRMDRKRGGCSGEPDESCIDSDYCTGGP